MKKLLVVSVLTLALWSCKNEANKSNATEAPVVSTEEPVQEQTPTETANASDAKYMPFTVNDALAEKVASFLKNDHFKSDYSIMSDNDKKFQMAEVDLNNDGKKEIFLNFFSSYFCGTGGCALLLLDHDLNVITKFSVTRTPLYLSKDTQNDWKTIMVKFHGKNIRLIYDGKSYPSNPSVVTPVDEAPSGHDLILFDDNFSPSKTYKF
ncbi:hypothetical protein KO493_02660 [Tamlana agarivorans]|uniref:Uncharacterized protein n=1 Tax=Pseudotamlana agarivorans TaxID=481183 RepID=A0ACC5U5M0_9FLAO|nr:hypothetical protein [Tamlana agarivorans]MBU2949595.1 hypothetical protein [Tamlana agarivorans]